VEEAKIIPAEFQLVPLARLEAIHTPEEMLDIGGKLGRFAVPVVVERALAA
jgi:hypothetical protein